MPTDITIFIEKFTPEIGWKVLGEDQEVLGEHFLTRNYILYSILSNEERDYKQINKNTTSGLIPIALPRGVPTDSLDGDYNHVKFEKDQYNRWYPSWVTLQEILDYPHWDTFLLAGVNNYSLKEYQEFLKTKEAHEVLKIIQMSWTKVTELDKSKLPDLLKNIAKLDERSYEVMVHHKKKYRDFCEVFLTKCVPELIKLVDKPEYLRLVYYFG